MGHVTGNPDVVHTASDPADCACQRYRKPPPPEPTSADADDGNATHEEHA